MLDINKVYKMDCFDFLKKLDDNSVDLAVLDPPYNLKKADWDTFKTQQDFFDFSYKWIDALIPKLKKTGSLYIFNTPFNSAYLLKHLIDRGLEFQNWITWDKRDGMSATKTKYNNGQETILFFTKSKKHTFNYNEIRVPYESIDRMAHAEKVGILKNGKRWFPNPSGKLCREVWHFTSQRHKSKINGKTQKMSHLTPKPLDMIERIIKASSKSGDLVIDFFVGSGTTAIASKKLKRNFICSDIDSNYVKLTREKLKTI